MIHDGILMSVCAKCEHDDDVHADCIAASRLRTRYVNAQMFNKFHFRFLMSGAMSDIIATASRDESLIPPCTNNNERGGMI